MGEDVSRFRTKIFQSSCSYVFMTVSESLTTQCRGLDVRCPQKPVCLYRGWNDQITSRHLSGGLILLMDEEFGRMTVLGVT